MLYATADPFSLLKKHPRLVCNRPLSPNDQFMTHNQQERFS